MATVALLARIAWVDLTEQKIRNHDVVVLLGLGCISLAVGWFETGLLWNAATGAAAGLVIFLLLIPFWLLRKVGAGDVKLLAVAPIICGGHDLLIFSLLLLATAMLTALMISNPLLLPEGMFRRYISMMERKGVVPFGVPISGALIGVLVLQAAMALRPHI